MQFGLQVALGNDGGGLLLFQAGKKGVHVLEDEQGQDLDDDGQDQEAFFHGSRQREPIQSRMASAPEQGDETAQAQEGAEGQGELEVLFFEDDEENPDQQPGKRSQEYRHRQPAQSEEKAHEQRHFNVAEAQALDLPDLQVKKVQPGKEQRAAQSAEQGVQLADGGIEK